MMRFGLIRSAVRINSRIVISPVPSRLAHLASRVTRFGISRIRSSALSSIEIMHHKTYTYYNCFKNRLFTRNLNAFKHKNSTLFFKGATFFMFVLCFTLSYLIIYLAHLLPLAFSLPMREYMCLM